MSQRLSRARVSELTCSLFNGSARAPRLCYTAKWLQLRGLSTAVTPEPDPAPLRKHLKEQAKRKRAEERDKRSNGKHIKQDQRLERWELTVGIEVHAQLNTACKLFSNAPADAEGDGQPNTDVAFFDAAMPGTQPSFQIATLLPAIRAALALGCTIQRESSWDRKHYFHWDQPNGYQITQYYRPFAKNGQIIVTADDGVPAADLQGAESLAIGIKQIQMEQDTAKTTLHQPSTYHVDLNRAGHALIEVITLPQIHSPQTAAAVVRKLQAVLKSADACVVGMELGGLRADVNVSVRLRGTNGDHAYSGVSGLGQRTEIKNLSSFKAVEEAIVAERDRQISVLEAGGKIEGETRGWTLGASETTRLRGKEGEVDYRYLPDADLPPLLISDALVGHLRETLPELPEDTIQRVQQTYGLTAKDARTIVSLDDGDRLEFMEQTVHLLKEKLPDASELTKVHKTVGNWVIHELGGHLTNGGRAWKDLFLSPREMADIIYHLLNKQITARSAKVLIMMVDDSDVRLDVAQLIDEHGLHLKPLDDEGYISLAKRIMDENPAMVSAIKDKGQRGKIMWFVGQMVREGDDSTILPEKAREVVEQLLDM
ncbi:hypothetical protein AMS68_001767 [Peltaster fructicola]|uniref:Glutamyl-tRNA(Gln) amidotransferase subunit B, mitochondrial n=1 Tax=Peltaster fructicola TaxID=286661 RepID=A0A6H0XP36_9PEZI|nr:hypothetical protein AMS68_001767 [Peltaster fructicola]